MKNLFVRTSALAYLLLFLAAAGFADALYLTIHHYTNTAVVCGPGFGSCSTVLSSSYATVGPVPLAAVGTAYYLIGAILAYLFAARKMRHAGHAALALFAAGFLASSYFIYLQLAVLEAICIYCVISAAITTLAFATSIYLVKRNPHAEPKPAPENARI